MMFRLFGGSWFFFFILLLAILEDSHGHDENNSTTSKENAKNEKKSFQKANSDRSSRKNNGVKNGNVFVKSSSLGNIKLDQETYAGGPRKRVSPGFRKSENEAILTLQQILKDHTVLGTGKEQFHSSTHYNSFVEDPVTRHKHLRFEQTTSEGLPVVGAAMMMHVDEQGNVYAVNGEFVPEDGNPDAHALIVKNCEEAFEGVLEQTQQLYNAIDVNWISAVTPCELKVVVDKNGVGHKVWERLIGFQPVVATYATTGEGRQPPYQKNILYASVVTGRIVAVHPQVMGALSIETYDCVNDWVYEECYLVSDSSTKISSGDLTVDGAHNYAIDTYRFYKEQFGRDSLDDRGLKLINFVHVGENFSNAFWSDAMVYGDGDDYWFGPLSRSIEVVAHEITHGLTQYTSGLVYTDESGALNEGLSDILGAVVSRVKGGQSPDNVWKLAEGVYTPKIAGDAMRYMNNPMLDGSSNDYYFDRYVGFDDNGGVHWNSGIANLAFYLLASGGSHPRLPSDTVIPLDPDFDVSLLSAARIFYMANTACLTPVSGFHAARECTMLHAGSAENTEKVSAAWKAVGVSTDGVPLTNGVPVTDLNAPPYFRYMYILYEIPPFSTVTCMGEAAQGSFDLEVDLVSFNSPTDYCNSSSADMGMGLIEDSSCTVGPARSEGTIFMEIYTEHGFEGGTIQCEFVQPILLTNNETLLNLSASSGDVTNYVLESIPENYFVRCNIEGDNGDADLKVNLQDEGSEGSSCSSSSAYSVESCSVGPTIAPEQKALVQISAYVQYSGLSLTCRQHEPRCNAEGGSCNLDEDCCEPGKSLRCHQKKRKCIACKTKNSRCKKSIECCSGKCIKSRRRGGGKRCK